MPRYKITAPDGREVTVEGPRPPTNEDAVKLFASLPPKPDTKTPYVKETVVLDQPPLNPDDPDYRLKLTLRGGSPNGRSDKVDGSGVLTDIALEGGGATAGQIAGGFTGPFAPAAVPVLGALGGGVGNYAAQKRRIAAGEQEKISLGELLSSIGTSAIPGGPLAASGGRAVLREGAKQAAGGLLAKNVQTLIDEGRVATPTEGVLSTVLPAAGGALAQRIQAANPRIQAAVAAAPPRSVAANTLEAAQELGAVVPPSMANPSWVNKRIESLAGPADVKRGASEINERVMKQAAARELGLPENTEITMPVLADVRRRASAAYDDVAALSPAAAADLGALRDARSTASLEFGHYNRSGVPDALRRGQAASQEADLLEAALEGHAATAGRPELMDRLREARTRLAKSHDVERALNLGNAAVESRAIGRLLDKGRPLSGELETMGAFAEAFPGANAPVSGRQPTGLSKTEHIVGGLLATGTGISTGSPYSALAYLAPAAASTVARRMVLSAPYQRLVARVPDPVVNAAPDTLATAIRQLSQAAGSNEEAAKLFTAPGSMAPAASGDAPPPKKSASLDLPTLTPTEAKSAPPGTRFLGSNGKVYEKTDAGKIQVVKEEEPSLVLAS